MNRSEPSPSATANQKQGRARLWAGIGGAVVLIGLAVGLGRSFGHHIPAVEAWIAGQGAWGYVAFVGLVVVGTSIFVRDTAFAVMAGVLFGVLEGTVVMGLACLLTAAVDYSLARMFLQAFGCHWLERKPQLAAIPQAVEREGLRFQFLLRLTPINPVMVSYVLGATGVRFVTFLVACLGLLPALFVEVYFGYVAKHVAKISGNASEHSPLHSALTIAGLVLCIIMMVYVVRVARRAISSAERATPSDAGA